MSDNDNQSEVAQIRQQIAAEQESAQRALHSPAYGASQHRFITARMERQGTLHARLKAIVGEAEAARIISDILSKEEGGKDNV